MKKDIDIKSLLIGFLLSTSIFLFMALDSHDTINVEVSGSLSIDEDGYFDVRVFE